eukprot:GHVU01029742.1.p2 GENE.GHVU01029742.1~~GHVU01029742.1.p2  ORF type:complete len:182 (-),score=13.96 GHVU01029742.1:1097-1642(-)
MYASMSVCQLKHQVQALSNTRVFFTARDNVGTSASSDSSLSLASDASCAQSLSVLNDSLTTHHSSPYECYSLRVCEGILATGYANAGIQVSRLRTDFDDFADRDRRLIPNPVMITVNTPPLPACLPACLHPPTAGCTHRHRRRLRRAALPRMFAAAAVGLKLLCQSVVLPPTDRPADLQTE